MYNLKFIVRHENIHIECNIHEALQAQDLQNTRTRMKDNKYLL